MTELCCSRICAVYILMEACHSPVYWNCKTSGCTHVKSRSSATSTNIHFLIQLTLHCCVLFSSKRDRYWSVYGSLVLFQTICLSKECNIQTYMLQIVKQDQSCYFVLFMLVPSSHNVYPVHMPSRHTIGVHSVELYQTFSHCTDQLLHW
jgi:hypothetical protein